MSSTYIRVNWASLKAAIISAIALHRRVYLPRGKDTFVALNAFKAGKDDLLVWSSDYLSEKAFTEGGDWWEEIASVSAHLVYFHAGDEVEKWANS